MWPIVWSNVQEMSAEGSPDLPPLCVLSPLVTSSVIFNSGNNVTHDTSKYQNPLLTTHISKPKDC